MHGHIPEADAKLPQQIEPHLLPHLLGRHSPILADGGRISLPVWVVFNQFREYHLKLKPSKCSFFKEEINYLAHWVSKEGVQPNNSKLKVITECAPPQMYTEVHAFLSLVGHYQWFIKGFVHIAQLLNEHLTGEGASRKSERVLLSKGTLEAFETLKKGMYDCPHFGFC